MKSKKKEMEDIQRNPSLAGTFGMKAEYDYKSAKSNFEKLETTVWEDFDRQRAEIRAALESTFRKANEPRPEDVDRDGLELLRSGILTIDEIGGFLDRYENSPAMRRLTDQHIEKLLEETKDPQSRHALIMLRQKAGVSDVIEAWENLEHTDFLQRVKRMCQFDYWFLGHYHRNCVVDDRFIVQWEQMVELHKGHCVGKYPMSVKHRRMDESQ